MSIPPLVCSTPPPPDQCEDDKDHEDFDIHYNLSQDDYDDHYDFGSFSTHDHFQSSSQIKNDPVIIKSSENKIVCDAPQQNKDCIENDETNIITELKPNLEEETNIEDLHLEDLKVEQDVEESIDIIEKNTENTPSDPSIDSSKNTEVSESLRDLNCPDFTLATPIQPEEFVIEPSSIDEAEEPPSYVDAIIAAVDNIQITPTEPELPLDVAKTDVNKTEPLIVEEQVTVMLDHIKTEITPEDNIIDDFGDFEDIQFANSDNKPKPVDSCDNPWVSNHYATGNDFGNFEANFDEVENPEELNKVPVNKVQQSFSASGSDPDVPADDEFGDFNDFQSSSASAAMQPSVEDEEVFDYPLLNLKQPDKLLETINEIIYSIFEEEIPELEEEVKGNLDSELGVTWGFLLQTDERQPYMVNWNNSLGQKTLLKALCIDSRNILFGPKWNSNMPKYAATLSVAPLQPQKQISNPSTSQVEITSIEKSAIKPGTWTEPFSAEGQESCNADASSCANSVPKIEPTDLDVFEASASSKPDKIFSSTLNVQPLRQISLPDTHIFTPTDSETPRSTTIHYDSGPTVLLPQSVIEARKNEQSYKIEKETPSDNEEYWEFQDFRGSSKTIQPAANTTPRKTESSNINPGIGYAIQVLQPVKVEPIIPKLNWPDPGEVKETFDDFTDFVSNSALSNPQQHTPTVPIQNIDSKLTHDFDIAGPSSKGADYMGGDDDFDTFQSAKPTNSVDLTSVSQINYTAGGNTIISQSSPQTMTDNNVAFPRLDNAKSETISINNVSKPKDLFLQNQIPVFPNNLEIKTTSVHTSGGAATSVSLLHPTPASTSGAVPSQPKSGQILQPLSLESFSQINWPNPGIDLQDLSRFNPVETLHSLKSDLSVNSLSKVASPMHGQKKSVKGVGNQPADDDWGEFVSSAPVSQPHAAMPKKQSTLVDDDEWTDFVSSPSVKPQNGLNTISLNVHTNFQSKPSKFSKGSKVPLEIPTLNYITPKSTSHKSYNDRHFQNL